MTTIKHLKVTVKGESQITSIKASIHIFVFISGYENLKDIIAVRVLL